MLKACFMICRKTIILWCGKSANTVLATLGVYIKFSTITIHKGLRPLCPPAVRPEPVEGPVLVTIRFDSNVIANGAKQSRVPSFSRTVIESFGFGGQALFICLFKLLRSSFSITTKPSIDVAPGSTMSWCVIMTVMIAYLPGMGVSRIGEEWEKT
jgi:hypothetical protein